MKQDVEPLWNRLVGNQEMWDGIQQKLEAYAYAHVRTALIIFSGVKLRGVGVKTYSAIAAMC